MATQASSGIARRRATFRRVTIAALVLVCLALFTGYFREADEGPLHGAQSAAASVVAPIQEGATRAVQPLRDAWGWATSLRDARDRAASLQERVDVLQAKAADNVVRDERLRELEALAKVEALPQRGYELVTGLVTGHSISDFYRTARINKGTADGVRSNSPVVASGEAGAALAGIVIRASAHTADVSFVTDGRTEVGAKIPEAGNFAGLLQSTVPGQLRLTNVPQAAAVRLNQVVVTGGFARLGLQDPYPPGIPVGFVSSVGRREVDVQQTVQVSPYVDPRRLDFLTVYVPRSEDAIRRATG